MKKTVIKEFKHFQEACEHLSIKTAYEFNSFWGCEDMDEHAPNEAEIKFDSRKNGSNYVIVHFHYETL